ncbi:MAG: hypothetical protein ACC651_12620 [Candidatus Scalindua sp.]
MDCQNIVFSPQQSENRINKALKVLPLKILKRILAFALYILGAKVNVIGSLMEMSGESVKTTNNRIMKDGLPAFRDRRESMNKSNLEISPPPREHQTTVLVQKDYYVIIFENMNHQLKILRNNRVHIRTVLLSLLRANLVTVQMVSSILNITPAHCRELSGKLANHDVPEVLIDKRKGQTKDFLVDLEVKAELIQNFAARVISGHSTSSKVLTEIINDNQKKSISPRTIRWHMNKLGLMKIKKTLPDLVTALKKTPKSSCSSRD